MVTAASRPERRLVRSSTYVGRDVFGTQYGQQRVDDRSTRRDSEQLNPSDSAGGPRCADRNLVDEVPSAVEGADVNQPRNSTWYVPRRPRHPGALKALIE